MELIGIRLWKGVAKQIAGISRCLPARRRVGGERTALGEKRTLKSHTHKTANPSGGKSCHDCWCVFF